MRDLSTRMIEAVLDGEGLRGVAELAAAEAGGPVAIVLPARGLTATAPQIGELNGLSHYAEERLAGGGAPPDSVEAELPVAAGGEEIGVVMLLARQGVDGSAGLRLDRGEVLHAAALATLAAAAVSDARTDAEDSLRGSLIEELRSGELRGGDLIARASRLGCDLSRGAVALASEAGSARPGHAVALVASEYPGALAEVSDGRLRAILPASGGDDAPEVTLAAAARLARRLRKHGPAAVSSFYLDPGELGEALREAELVVDVVARDDRIAEALDEGVAASGVYRLLFRALISDPGEVRSFYFDTVEPIVRYDGQYRTDLLGTLEEYLARDCNMNATARAIYAHRHTVAYRLDRVRELTGLDPSLSEDRERLGLGVKAYRILMPTLPR